MAKDQPHDTLFKETFSSPENAASHLQAVLPAAITSRIDWDSLTSVSTEFIVKLLDTVQADVLLKAKIEDRDCFIYVLFEHQSTQDAVMAFRMLRYVVCIWSDYLKQTPNAKVLPPVIPCVLYHGPQPWKAATNCLDLIDLDQPGKAALGPLLPSMAFHLDDLRALSSEQIQQRMASAFVRLTLLALRNLQGGDARAVAEFFQLAALLREVAEAESGPDALATILCYLLNVADPDTDQVQNFLDQQLGSRGREAFVTAAERLTKEAAEKARSETLARAVLKQLALKFGPLRPETVQQVQQSTIEQLDAMVERVLTAKSIDDVLA